MQDYHIRFYLLCKQPQITVNDEPLAVTPQALKLLIYLADSAETVYAREDLIRLVYGTVLARDTFRKKVMYPIRQRIPDFPLETGRGDLLYFERDKVWVDSRVFVEETRELLDGIRRFGKDDYRRAQDILELHQEAFLLDYHPKSGEGIDDSPFLAWQNSRRRDLVALYHQLLDQTIRYGVKQQRHWSDAQRFAERWRGSLNPSAKPLQYLIWLAAHQHSDALNSLLVELRERETAGELPMGPSWAEWDRVLKRGKTMALSRLLPDTAPEANSVGEDRSDDLTGRRDVLEQILAFITVPRPEPVFAVTGLPGVGKTALTHAAARLLQERHPDYQVVRVEFSAQLDLEHLCNQLLAALGKPDLFTLDYAQKRQRLAQLLRAPRLVVILDEGHTTHLANPDTLTTVLTLLDGACVLLVARVLPRFPHFVVELAGLDEAQTRAFLVRLVPWLSDLAETQFTELAALTGGLPLLLHIIAGGLKKELGRMHSLLDALKRQGTLDFQRDVYTVYEQVLAWLWQYLDSKDKDLLYAISLFAPLDGAGGEDLRTVLVSVLAPERLDAKLNRLIALHLVERPRDASAAPRHALHPIILDFVRRRSGQRRRPYTQLIERAYIHYLLDLIDAHSRESDRLDAYQQSVLHLFDLVLFGDDHVWARPQAIESLNRIFPYFEMRGLHAAASRLFTRALDLGQFASVTTHIQMLRSAAKIASIRADDEEPLKLYQRALDVAQDAAVTTQYASLYHGIGSIYMEKGRFREAIQNFETAARWVDAAQQKPLLYAIWSNLGVCASRQGQFERARQHYQKVLAHLGGSGIDLPPELQTIAQFVQTWLGITCTELGDYETAMRHFDASMALARVLNYPQLMGYLYLNIGLAYCYQAAYDEADDCFHRASLIAEQIEHAALRTQVTFNQAILASKRSLHQEALRLHRIALIEATDHDLTWVKPQILISLGKAYLRVEQFESAQQPFGEVLQLPQITAAYIAQALYGLASSVVLKAHFIGDNRVETTFELIHPRFDSLPLDRLPLQEVGDYLDWTHTAFQRDLDHIPQLARYRIVDALHLWIAHVGVT